MLDPRTWLPIDAPPLVPYDDGFSTETEDDDIPEVARTPPDNRLHDVASIPVNGAGITENQSKISETKQKSHEMIMVQGRGATLKVNTKTGQEIIEIDDEEEEDKEEEQPKDGEEEGEVCEEMCRCCNGKLPPLASRIKMMKEAAQSHGGNGPPPSRRCACCRITYPSEALTKKSRKMTRAVPICLACSKAGGSAIYEMLVTSAEFIEAFQIENPTMARQLLQKKAQIIHHAEAQRKQVKNPKPPIVFGGPCRQTAVRRRLPSPVQPVQLGSSQQVLFDEEGIPQVPEASHRESRTSRDSRWLKQFELVNGKAVRERRLAKRNTMKEQKLDAKKQRTSSSPQ